jgi:hypothetical protein
MTRANPDAGLSLATLAATASSLFRNLVDALKRQEPMAPEPLCRSSLAERLPDGCNP